MKENEEIIMQNKLNYHEKKKSNHTEYEQTEFSLLKGKHFQLG